MYASPSTKATAKKVCSRIQDKFRKYNQGAQVGRLLDTLTSTGPVTHMHESLEFGTHSLRRASVVDYQNFIALDSVDTWLIHLIRR